MDLFQRGDETRNARKEILMEQRQQLAVRLEEMQKTLVRLDYKMKIYDEEVQTAEKDMKKIMGVD